MDEILDEIEFQITQFTQAVENLESNFPDTKVFGSTRARTPLIHKFKIRCLLDTLDKRTAEKDVLKSYEQTNERFDEFLKSNQSQYEQSVIEEYYWFVEQFPKLVCTFLEREPMSNELIETLDRRDTMEILRRYVSQIVGSNPSINKNQVDRATIKIDALDEVLQCRFVENLNEILTSHSNIQRPYYPNDFWWRHPEELE